MLFKLLRTSLSLRCRRSYIDGDLYYYFDQGSEPKQQSGEIVEDYPSINSFSHRNNRMAVIYKKARNTMQSATYRPDQWMIRYEAQNQWENPLMGWVSSADPLSNIDIDFDDIKDAIAYCNKYGISFTIRQPAKTKPSFATYAENFSWSSPKRTSTK
ncbi:NADH dehydrogenase [ubiquinone] iron-sulfur protein 4, mitochondrial [Thelohanellus kitauei]|uniref:NADH dehydrogenase [ubiquinone] iron-sulfur protein 4, mitochondrial n=1 Tax=Thelohanellus kitauei TaxID=669202 RepID=A0A0C2MSJ3_THEKT|nr:NADH dehydrogenase [ubiquinone] iron-sulfur protein 4, mitochondrial [Thelohanellus kitauei]